MAIFLSGGLDSVSIAAIAADASERSGAPPPRALSLLFPAGQDEGLDEAHVQQAVAADLGLPQDLVPFHQAAGPEGLFLSALSMTTEFSAPMVNAWSPVYRYLALRGREAGCRVVLNGSGGDEWLTVSPSYAADLMRALNLAGLLHLFRSMEHSYRFSRVDLLRSVLWYFGARRLLRDAAQRLRPLIPAPLLRRRRDQNFARTFPAWVAPDPELRRELRAREERAIDTAPPIPRSHYMRDVRTGIDHPLMALEMEEGFEHSRQIGMMQLAPFWDADLVDFLYRTPPHLLNRGGCSKGLVRDMLARRFPHLGFGSHKKVAATGFFRSIMQREGPAAWKRMSGVPTLQRLGVVHAHALEEHLHECLVDREGRHSYRIWDALNLEAWSRSRS